MCGICGLTRDPGGAAVAAMNDAMQHRGPDDEGVYVDTRAGTVLGARRLSVIDVEHGHQPLCNEDGTVWAALNGEIYNHPSLRTRLRERGHRLATRTDTEVLVHLYEDYGTELVHALEGMFAFAIWDERRGVLLLARDRFGEKPLFYSEYGSELAFASELTALRAGAALADELDPMAVDRFFVFGYVPGPGSIVQGIRQLPPGHLLAWESSSRRSAIRRYWSPPCVESPPGEPLPQLIAETGRLVESAVKSRMIADVPLGVFLSGGVDSTLIAAMAARQSRERIKTFTVGYDVGSVSETDAARRTAALLDTDHHELLLTGSDIAARAPELLANLDQPLADQALVALHAVAELARREVTVVVGGEGADELFGGYPRYRWLARAARLDELLPPALAVRSARALAASPLGGRWARLADVLRPQPLVERHLDWVTAGRRHLRGALYGPLLDGRRVDGELLDGLIPPTPPEHVPGELMRLDQRHWLPHDVLVKADRAGMLVSLEVRTPYLHWPLAEFAATVAARTHVAHDGKVLLRGVAAKLMPGTPRRRPKTAFRVPAADWLRGPLEPALAAQLAGGALYEEGWFDREEVRRLAREHAARRADWTHALWPLLALGLWLDRFRGRDAR